jgi:hypothetical protein
VGVTLGMLVAVSPVAAATELGRSGVVGPHKVVDKQSSAGAACSYEHLERFDVDRLVEISVSAPHVWAVSGQQMVGWNFSVQRMTTGMFGHGPWSTRYTSPRFTESATETQEADFTYANVRVRVPRGIDREEIYDYRVIVKLFWLGDNGSVTGSARKLLHYYYRDDGHTYDTLKDTCSAY